MRPIDVRRLIKFNTYMSMYTRRNRDGVVSFLQGYEYAVPECHFIQAMSDCLEKKYKIKKNALGWPDQIARFQITRFGEDWMESYLVISSLVLANASENLRAKKTKLKVFEPAEI